MFMVPGYVMWLSFILTLLLISEKIYLWLERIWKKRRVEKIYTQWENPRLIGDSIEEIAWLVHNKINGVCNNISDRPAYTSDIPHSRDIHPYTIIEKKTWFFIWMIFDTDGKHILHTSIHPNLAKRWCYTDMEELWYYSFNED